MKDQFTIWILTLFPEYFHPLQECGVVGSVFKGTRSSINLQLKIIDLRQFGLTKHKCVDDYPYGGGPGMIMRADVLEQALIQGIWQPLGLDAHSFQQKLEIVYLSPRGDKWDHTLAKKMAEEYWSPEKSMAPKDLVFLCGRYEGIDQRFIDAYVAKELSLGDFIVSGGELALLVILDSALRFLPGTLGNKESGGDESFENILLEGPQYTRPEVFGGQKVPEVLLSGHHQRIKDWHQEMREEVTQKYRPDLWQKHKAKNDGH